MAKRKKKRGRPRNVWVPFEEARTIIRAENIHSVIAYHKWHKKNQPQQIPNYPNKVYKNEGWVSWNDWLGNNNKFITTGHHIIWRDFDEALIYVHRLKLKTFQDYYDLYRAKKLPEDFPGRPDYAYSKRWISWNHWLGNNLRAAVEAKQEAVAVAVFYIVQLPDRPSNVFKFGVATGGKSQILDMQKATRCQIIKLFKMEPQFHWISFIKRYGTEWEKSGIEGEYLIMNIHQLMFDVDLEWVN